MKRSHAILALLVVGALLAAAAATYAAPPFQTTSSPIAAPPSQDDAQAYLTLNLEAGFPLDPFIVSANGGGPVDASAIDEDCTGYVNQNPTLAVDWSGRVEQFRVFYFSDHDPTLMIRLPDGKYVCNDNAHRLLLDPVITLDDPQEGNYRIWVGAADEGQLVPGILVITTREEVTLGNFNLANLVKRGSVADTLEEPVATDERKAMAEKLLKGVVALKAAHDTGRIQTFSRDVEAAGEIEAHELPIYESFCNGYIAEQPSLVFDVPENEQDLIIYFEGNGDSTLVLAKPDGTFLCNDDVDLHANVNPLIFIDEPPAGQYVVWVGRVNTDAPIKGKLTVTELAKQPVKLAPKPAPTPAK